MLIRSMETEVASVLSPQVIVVLVGGGGNFWSMGT